MLQKKRLTITLLGIAAIMGLSLGIFVFQHLHPEKQKDYSAIKGTVLTKPREVSAFSLEKTSGEVFDNHNLQGHWTFLFFGFTQCHSICPTTMAELGKMVRLLEQQTIQPLPQIVMITLDPEMDTSSRLGNYVKAFHPSFQGARGSEKAVAALAQEMGIAYAKVVLNQDNPKQYNIEHTGTIILINPQGEIAAFFTMPHRAQDLAQDYHQFVA